MSQQIIHASLRGAVVLAAAALGCHLAWMLTRVPAQRLLTEIGEQGWPALARMPLDRALTGICSLALLACAGWLLVTTVALVVEAVTTTEWVPPRLCPTALRRLVLTACGVALASPIAPPAFADPPGARDPATVAHARLSGLALPDRAVGGPPTRLAHVVVCRADSLWTIARSTLGDRATDAEIAAATSEIHRANRGRIGPDPDLILPGTHLRLPPLRHDREEHR